MLTLYSVYHAHNLNGAFNDLEVIVGELGGRCFLRCAKAVTGHWPRHAGRSARHPL
jgi:hypothetical protein